MKVKLIFRNISGQVLHGSFTKKTKVQDICNFLNDSLNTKNNIVYLISKKPQQLFYKNDDDIKNLLKAKNNDILFLNLNHDKMPQQKQIIAPPASAMNAYKNFTEIKNIGLANRCIYAEYAEIVKSVPDDIENRVNQLVQFGYDVEDCREALRDAYYDVNRAADILIRRYSNISDEEINDNSHHFYSMLDILRFMFSNQMGSENSDDLSDDNDDSQLDIDMINSEDIKEDSENETSDHPDINPNDTPRLYTRIATPRLPLGLSSPRSAINRQRTMNQNANNQEEANQNLPERRNIHQIARPAIVNQRSSLITRPYIRFNQRGSILSRNSQTRPSGQ